MFPVGQADELETPKWGAGLVRSGACVCSRGWGVCLMCVQVYANASLVKSVFAWQRYTKQGCLWLECWGESLSLRETVSKVGGIKGMWSHLFTYVHTLNCLTLCVLICFCGLCPCKAEQRGVGWVRIKSSQIKAMSSICLPYSNVVYELAHR